MVELRTDDRADRLLTPVRDVVLRGLAQFPDGGPLSAEVGAVEGGIYAIHSDTVVLSDALVGPGLHHPLESEGPIPPLDRWRRAVACVLEAAALRELSRRTHLPVGDDWRWVGAAIHAADVVVPELRLADPDVALAIGYGSPGEVARAGVAVMRAWARAGTDPIRHVRYLIEGGVLSAVEWGRIGAWVLSPTGAAAELPVPVGRVTEADIPLALPPWSWRPLAVPAHPRGGRIRIEGDGFVDEPWAEADVELRAFAAAASTPCRFAPDPGGPIGGWDVASAEGFGQVMGARGLRFVFHADGRLEIVLADAFVGPLAAVTMAAEVGTSGVATGRWRVVGEHRVGFHGVDTSSLTLHSRTRDRFHLPARGFGLGEWMGALSGSEWDWASAAESVRPEADRLVLRGRMMGGAVEVRLRKAGGGAVG